jgi:LysR family transcriptional regulator, hydrogen peroxide-inducible genes activator
MTLVQMVGNGLGITLAPEMAVDAGLLNGLDLQSILLVGAASSRRIALAWRRTSTRRQTFKLLAKILRDTLAEESGPYTRAASAQAEAIG